MQGIPPQQVIFLLQSSIGDELGMDIASQYRHLFPVLEKVTYLNSCSQGALAIPVRDAINEYLNGMYEKGSLWDEWVMKQGELRSLVAKAFRTGTSNVAITGNASAAINSVLSTFDFSGSRNRIVTTDLEFPTMGQILHAQEKRGAHVVHVAAEPDGTLDLGKLEDALDERVVLVATTHICYRTGVMTDIKKVGQICHRQGIPVIVDAFQSVGSMPIDFDEVGVDFLTGGFLKYMLGLPGVGFLLVKDAFSGIPTQTGWFASRDIFAMEIDKYDPASEARRFEGGTPPIPSIYGALAGLHLLMEVGLERVQIYVRELQSHIRNEILGLGGTVTTPDRVMSFGPLISFQSKSEQMLVEKLAQDDVVVSSRAGNVRLSPHFYNTLEDVEKLSQSLYKHRLMLR
jgi:selenocysteine lyase/cysteine desulfurase